MQGMEIKSLFKEMTSSIGLSALNQESKVWSISLEKRVNSGPLENWMGFQMSSLFWSMY
jgi:hypothetical protein